MGTGSLDSDCSDTSWFMSAAKIVLIQAYFLRQSNQNAFFPIAKKE